MKQLSLIKNWLAQHNDSAYSIIRIFLGTALFVRGIILSANPAVITQLTGASQFYWWYSLIIVIHIIGGLLLAIGLLTRLASLVQILILANAVFFIHLKHGLMNVDQSLELSALVLILLVVFFIYGSGKLSVDNFFAKKKSGIKFQ